MLLGREYSCMLASGSSVAEQAERSAASLQPLGYACLCSDTLLKRGSDVGSPTAAHAYA